MDELDTAFAAGAGRLDEDWQAKARELGAMRRGRGFTDPDVLLCVLLIHLGQGGLINISGVAILKRLRDCGEWFKWMADGLRRKWLPDFAPGYTGSQWRLHYSV